MITSITLRLHPLTEAVSAAICTFPSMGDAVRSVIEPIQTGVPIERVEVIDALGIGTINRHLNFTLSEAPTLFFEFHAHRGRRVQAGRARAGTGCRQRRPGLRVGHRPEDRTRLWSARHNAFFGMLQLKPGCRAVTTDVYAPISQLAACVEKTEANLGASTLPCAIVGHVEDGNFHVALLLDPDQSEELEETEHINQRIVERALRMGVTCTGEHDVGLYKIRLLAAEPLPAVPRRGHDRLLIRRAGRLPAPAARG